MIGHRDGDRHFVSYDLGVSRFEPSRDDLDFIARHDAAHVYQHAGLDGWLGAISERSHVEAVWQAIEDPKKMVIVQTAPAIRATQEGNTSG